MPDLKIVAWPDADFNGDKASARSTTGYYIELVGNHGKGVPLSWASRRQTATATSTMEAEILSMTYCLKHDAIPIQTLLETITGRGVELQVMQDNNPVIMACRKGYSPHLRHMPRTHRTSIGFLKDLIDPDEPEEGTGAVRIVRASTTDHKGNCLTKALTVAPYKLEMSRIGVLFEGR